MSKIDAPEGHALRLGPSLMERRGAKWGKDAPLEEALSVLSVYSAQGYYVDIRVPRADGPGPLTATESHLQDAISSTGIDWAFAGKVRVQIPAPVSGSEGAQEQGDDNSSSSSSKKISGRAAWSRTIDTNSPFLTDEVDEADLTVQADGSILEVGQIPDSVTGEVVHFEEVWLGLGPRDGAEAGCVVFMAEEDGEAGTRGLVVRYGGWAQGILRLGRESATIVERWRLGTEGQYVRDFKHGSTSVSLPCTEPSTGKTVGSSFEVDGVRWRVLELVE